MLVNMKSYRQYCALARGLDLIGDRWVLLIVRELLNGPRRYGELAHGLPGIATNLLAERLRTMQANGLVAKTDDDRYQLTEWGDGLREVLFAIGRWAGPLMGRMAEGDTFRSHWIVHPVVSLFPGVDPTRPELTVEVRCGEAPMTIRQRPRSGPHRTARHNRRAARPPHRRRRGQSPRGRGHWRRPTPPPTPTEHAQRASRTGPMTGCEP
jgi:DNA-binding HxlR family transcriptional regulator